MWSRKMEDVPNNMDSPFSPWFAQLLDLFYVRELCVIAADYLGILCTAKLTLPNSCKLFTQT